MWSVPADCVSRCQREGFWMVQKGKEEVCTQRVWCNGKSPWDLKSQKAGFHIVKCTYGVRGKGRGEGKWWVLRRLKDTTSLQSALTGSLSALDSAATMEEVDVRQHPALSSLYNQAHETLLFLQVPADRRHIRLANDSAPPCDQS